MVVIMISLASLLVLFLLCASLYLAFGWFKFFYHNILKWHEPKKKDKHSYEVSHRGHCVCKYCGNEIMQDSQGNWFEV